MMRDILKYSLVLFTAWMTLSGCQKFTEPEPYQRADMESNMTLKDFKALYAGTPVEFADTTSIVLEGKIISSDRSGNLYRTLYIEDSTAGIEVKIGKTGLYNDYKMGQTLYIQPRGLCLGDYNGVLQIGLKSYDSEYETTWIDVQTIIDRTVFRGDAGEPLPPTDIMSKSQITDAMLCRYVRIMGFTYQGGDNGLQTWAVSDDPDTVDDDSESGNQNFMLEGMKVVVRSSGYASFADTRLLDMGLDIGTKCNISGILTKYDKTYQLVLLDLDGVEVLD